MAADLVGLPRSGWCTSAWSQGVRLGAPRRGHGAVRDPGSVARDLALVNPERPADPDRLTARQRERRERIVDAAVEHMLTTPYERIQVKDVAASAGVALGTLYRYFSSKDHLFAEALLSWFHRYPSAPPRAAGRSVDHLRRAFSLAVRGFEPNPTAYQTLLALQTTTDPYAVDLFARFTAETRDAFEGFLPRIEPERRARIVDVMNAVLDVNLRRWATGQKPIAEVYEGIDSAAELLLGSR